MTQSIANFSEEEVEHMLDNLDAFTDEEIVEIVAHIALNLFNLTTTTQKTFHVLFQSFTLSLTGSKGAITTIVVGYYIVRFIVTCIGFFVIASHFSVLKHSLTPRGKNIYSPPRKVC